MKRNRIFLIGSALIIPVIVYFSSQPESIGVKSNPVINLMPNVEKPSIQPFAAKDGDLDEDNNIKAKILKLETDVAQLKSEMLALRTSSQARPVTTNMPVNSAPPDPVKELQRRNELKAKEDEQLRQQGEQLEANFRQQTTNPEWSDKVNNLLQTALSKDNVPSSSIIDIACRATMCRLELTNDANHQAPKMSEFPVLVGEELPNVRVSQTEESDGSTSTVMYLSKDDFVLSDSGFK